MRDRLTIAESPWEHHRWQWKNEKRLLTVKELADYLRVNQTTIYRLIRRSEIPAFKVGGDWRFNIESIDDWRLSADSASIGRATRGAGRFASAAPNADSHGVSRAQVLSSSVTDTPDAIAVPMRIYEAISQMLGPIAEISRMLPTLKWIAEALEDKRDAAGEIARLYEAHAIPFRTNSGKLLEFSSIPFAW